MAEMEPSPKKAKTDEGEVNKDEEMKDDAKDDAKDDTKDETKEAEEVKEPEAPKAPEPPKELETDAAVDAGKPRIKDKVGFNVADTTMNLMPSLGGSLLKSLSDGGVQHLLAGARANVGVKSGRYMFEAKVVEIEAALDEFATKGSHHNPVHRQILKIGFTTGGSSIFVGEDENGICFDSEGSMIHNRTRTGLFRSRFARENVASVLLNLDEKSPNANTISLFLNGKRMCQPQALPESLKGKELFPTVTFRNMTIHANFGPVPLSPLPFTCNMVGAALVKDSTVVKPVALKDGKNDLVVPVGLPDEGPFDYLDMWHQKNPGYTEISDRAMVEWVTKSGVMRRGHRSSNDKPEIGSSIFNLDDGSVGRFLKLVAPMQNRNYVIQEVRGNLISDERKALVEKFPSAMFRKVAQVQIGEPNLEFKKKIHEMTLKQKQEASDVEFRTKLAEAKRQREFEKKQREIERARKKAEKVAEKAEKKRVKEQQKQEEAQKKAAEAAAKAAEEATTKDALLGAEKKEGEETEKKEGEEEKKEENKEEKKEEEAKQEEQEKKEEPEEEEEEEAEEEEEEEKDEPMDEDPPKVELTAEEKKTFFFKGLSPDMTAYLMSTSFAKFSLPEKDEGFDEIAYSWSKGIKSQEYIKKWILERKLSTRVEDLTPSKWFYDQKSRYDSELANFQRKLAEWKTAVHKKEADKVAKAAAKVAAAAAAEAAAKAKAEAAEAAAKAIAEGAEPAETVQAEKKEEEEAKPMEVEEKEEEEEEEPVDFVGLDVFGVADVKDVGGGMPLFKDFGSEDWSMMTLRYELHLLAHSFRRDVDDPEREGIHIDHLPFYYNKYFRKPLTPKWFGVDSYQQLVELIDDTVFITKKQVLESQLEGERECFQVFVMLTEEERRHRNLRLDMGEEAARLKVVIQQHHGNKGGYKGDNKGKGYDKGGKRDYQAGPGYQSQPQAGYQGGFQQQPPVGGGKAYGYQDPKGGKGYADPKGGKGYQDHKGYQDPKGGKGYQDHKGYQDPKGGKGYQDQQKGGGGYGAPAYGAPQYGKGDGKFPAPYPSYGAPKGDGGKYQQPYQQPYDQKGYDQKGKEKGGYGKSYGGY